MLLCDFIWTLVIPGLEAVVRTCSIEKVFLKFRKIHRKIPVPESLF